MSDKIKLIMDVDPGIDDALAVLLAIKSDKFDILGITLGSGNVDVDQCARNMSKILEIAKSEKIKVFKGEKLPRKVEYQDAKDTHGLDGLGEVYFAEKDISEEQSAIDFIIEKLHEYPGEIELLPLGPLTNMAAIIDKDKEVLNKAKTIRIMGGAVKVHGNCSPVAEYNFWVDPHAAKEFFKQQYENVILYPLDVTYEILLTPNKREMIKQFGTDFGEFIFNITQFYVDFHWEQERTLGCIINDPLVIADMIEPMVEFYEGNIDIVEDGIARGESVVNRWTVGITKIGSKVDHEKFFDVFLKTLFPEFVLDIEMMKEKGMI